jgi:hypothetical protein
MRKFIFLALFVGFILNIYCVEIKYTLLNGTQGKINVPEDIVKIITYKGNMNFIRQNGKKLI